MGAIVGYLTGMITYLREARFVTGNGINAVENYSDWEEMKKHYSPDSREGFLKTLRRGVARLSIETMC